jgi:hypothetical protein
MTAHLDPRSNDSQSRRTGRDTGRSQNPAHPEPRPVVHIDGGSARAQQIADNQSDGHPTSITMDRPPPPPPLLPREELGPAPENTIEPEDDLKAEAAAEDPATAPLLPGAEPEATASLPEQRKWFVRLGFDLYAVVEAHDDTRLKELSHRAVIALGQLRDDVEAAGFTTATSHEIARAIDGPDTASLQDEITYLVKRYEALDVTVGRLNKQSEPITQHSDAAADAEKKEAEYRWAKAAARFLIGATIGAAIAGPLIAVVPWPQMVGEIVKNAISGASGVLATEIGDPLTKGIGRKRGDE